MFGVKKLLVILMILFSCKPLVRQPYFKPTVTTEASGKQVAKQIVLLTSTSNKEIEQHIESDPHLEEKLNEILMSQSKRRKIIDTLRNILSWPKKLMLWKRNKTDDLHHDAEAELELALSEDKIAETNINVAEHNPKIIWQRTFDNNKSSILAKLNFGAYNALIYTVAPDKALYKAHYDNLFADTVVLYADDLNASLNSAGEVINIAEKRQKEIGGGLVYSGTITFSR